MSDVTKTFRAPSFRLFSGERVGCLALLLFAFASPALLHAQFQQPTPEELKMTADPKAPGAAAVYLYREETTDDTTFSGRIQSVYERVKVLTEKGKELATVRIPYITDIGKIVKIEGRTIHADGTVIPLTVKPDVLLDFKTNNFEEDSAVFTLPGVDVGSILEYRYKCIHKSFSLAPSWLIQQPYFVRKAHYSFNPVSYSSQTYSENIGSDAKVACCRPFSLDITDVPPQPNEDWMPPLNTLRWRVEFFYADYKSGKDYWNNAGKNWATAVKDIVYPTGYMKKAVAEIVAPSDTDEQKAIKIYAAVQKLDNTDFSRKKSKAERKKEKLKDIRSTEDVWKQKSGSSDDIALLYITLVRAAGLKAWPMMVVNRDRAIFDRRYLSLLQLDDFLAIVNISGKEVYLDPGQKMCPFGSLHWKHNIASGFRLTEKDAVLATTPADTYKSNVVHRIADLKIDEQGNVTGTARIVMTGPDALYWRQLALQNDVEEVKKQFIESMRNSLPEGVQADFDHFTALDDSNANLVAAVKVTGNIGAATGKHFFLPGLFFESRAKHPFVAQDKRVTPIDLHYAMMEQDDVIYHLPSGYTVDSVPHSSDVNWPDHALLQTSSTVKDSSVLVRRAFARSFSMLESAEYNDLHDFYLKVAAADQQQLVLTNAAPAAGAKR